MFIDDMKKICNDWEYDVPKKFNHEKLDTVFISENKELTELCILYVYNIYYFTIMPFMIITFQLLLHFKKMCEVKKVKLSILIKKTKKTLHFQSLQGIYNGNSFSVKPHGTFWIA